MRPKSAFLGQYDLNYTCEIVYYARAKGELHALREATPLVPREALRGSFRELALADYFRSLVDRLSPQGPDCAEWHALLSDALDRLEALRPQHRVPLFLAFEMDVLHLLGLDPEIEADAGMFVLRGERRIPISRDVAACLRTLARSGDSRLAAGAASAPSVLLDAARAVGVYYEFHVDCASDVRRTVLRMILKNNEEGQ